MPNGFKPSRKKTLEEAAKILGSTVSKIKRILKIAKTEPERLQSITWGSGKRKSVHELTAEQRKWLTSPLRLCE